MGGITRSIPKPMLKVGGNPIIEHQINVCKKYGVRDFYIAAGHLSQVICDYFGDGKKFGINVKCITETHPLGTAGAVKALEQKFKKDFLVIYGDMFFDIDLKRLFSFHKRKKSDLTIVLHSNDYIKDCDFVSIDKNCHITHIHKKPHDAIKIGGRLANSGIYIFTPKVLKFIKKNIPADIAHNVFPEVIKKLKVYGYITCSYIKDAGTPLRFKQIKRDFKAGKTGL